jgi:hypothetical protein
VTIIYVTTGIHILPIFTPPFAIQTSAHARSLVRKAITTLARFVALTLAVAFITPGVSCLQEGIPSLHLEVALDDVTIEVE